jgi:hypothetical protein
VVTPASQLLLEIVSVVSRVPAQSRRVSFAGDEELLRSVAAVSSAKVYGIVSVRDDGESAPRVCWSAVAELDGVRVTVRVDRLATIREQQAVSHWNEHMPWDSDDRVVGRSGWLRHLVEEG